MGKRQSIPQKSSKVKKGLHKATDSRKKLSKNLGLPDFGKFAPNRFKEKQSSTSATSASAGTPRPAASKPLSSTLQYALNVMKAASEYETRQQLLESTAATTTTSPSGTLGDTFETCQRSKKHQHQQQGTYKTFYKEFRKVIEASDILIEILDARDPLGCRCVELEQAIFSEFNYHKQIILLVNKIDLVPRDNVEGWLQYFQSQGLPVIGFTTVKSHVTKSCVSGLMKLIHKVARGGGGGGGGGTSGGAVEASGGVSSSKKMMTVGVIGYPNVGKSSVINALKRETVVAVGNTPGFTRVASEIQLSSTVKIMDCPGIIFQAELDQVMTAGAILRNAIKVEAVVDPIAPVEEILRRVPAKTLADIYQISPSSFADGIQFLTQVAVKKGKLGKRAEVLVEDTARIILKDWNDGRIPFFTKPPANTPTPTVPTAATAATATSSTSNDTQQTMEVEIL